MFKTNRMPVSKKILTIVFLILTLGYFAKAQSGGNSTYDFLNITNSARVASLGGQQVSINDDDLNMVFHNPSLLTPEMDHHLVLNYINYFAGTNFGYVGYALQPEKSNYTLAAGIHYLNYGTFTRADESGNITGTFDAADYALNLYGSVPLIDSMLRIGVNVKPIYSDYDTYTSLGLALDAGITYYNSEKLFTAALVIKNAGAQITRYSSSSGYESLPFEIQLGITKRLQHAPLRFSILGQQLQKPNLYYRSDEDVEDNTDASTGEEVEIDNLTLFAENLMRHVVIGIEFIPTKNFYVNLGYNYKRRQELKVDNDPGMVGFSYGFGIKVKRFHISYGRATYHYSGASNHFSVTTNISEWGNHL